MWVSNSRRMIAGLSGAEAAALAVAESGNDAGPSPSEMIVRISLESSHIVRMIWRFSECKSTCRKISDTEFRKEQGFVEGCSRTKSPSWSRIFLARLLKAQSTAQCEGSTVSRQTRLLQKQPVLVQLPDADGPSSKPPIARWPLNIMHGSRCALEKHDCEMHSRCVCC